MTELRSPFLDPQQPRQSRFGRSIFGWVLFILLAVMLITLLQHKQRNIGTLSFSDFDTRLRNGSMRLISIEPDSIHGELQSEMKLEDGRMTTTFNTALPTNAGSDFGFVRYILEHRGNAEVRIENNQSFLFQILIPLIPWAVIFCFIWLFVFRQLRRSNIKIGS